MIEGEAGRLPGALVVPEDARALVVLLHGIPSGRPADPNDPDTGYPGLAEWFATQGFAAVWFDMRGVREAQGSFSVAGWERDVHAVLDEILRYDSVAGLPAVLVGTSGSGPTAIRVAAERPELSGLATLAAVGDWEAPDFLREPEMVLLEFRSIGIIRDPNYPSDTKAWFDEFERDGIDVIAKISPRPVLIIHGEGDPVVPYHHAELLFQAASEPKELVRIPGGGHQLRRDPRALRALTTWIEGSVLRRARSGA